MRLADGKGVQAEFMRETTDVAWQKAGTHQQRPEILHVVISLMIIHFILGAQVEAKGRILEKSFAAPRWNIEQADPSGADDSKALLQGF
jgi:hypothetical protein